MCNKMLKVINLYVLYHHVSEKNSLNDFSNEPGI